MAAETSITQPHIALNKYATAIVYTFQNWCKDMKPPQNEENEKFFRISTQLLVNSHPFSGCFIFSMAMIKWNLIFCYILNGSCTFVHRSSFISYNADVYFNFPNPESDDIFMRAAIRIQIWRNAILQMVDYNHY